MKKEISPDENAMTQLMVAAAEGDFLLLQELIASGVDVNETDRRRGTALMYAAMNQHVEITNALLRAGANPMVRTHKGLSALDFARISKCEAIIHSIKSTVDEINAVREIEAVSQKKIDRIVSTKVRTLHFEVWLDQFFENLPGRLSRWILRRSTDPSVSALAKNLDEVDRILGEIELKERKRKRMAFQKLFDEESWKLELLHRQGDEIKMQKQASILEGLSKNWPT